jgi:hypothetical protein
MSLCMRKRSDNYLPIDQQLAFTINHAAAALDCSRSSIYELIKIGKLEIAEINGMRRVTAESLRRLVGASENT